MESPTRSEMKSYSSNLFHNILNPLTVLSLEIERQQNIPQKLQNQIDTMLHYITHLEYFVSMICDNVKQHLFHKTISVNTEIEKALEIFSYTVKQKHIEVLSFFLSEISFETNQLQFHQNLLELFHVFLLPSEENISPNQKIEITLQKKKTHFSLIFSLSNISYDSEKLTAIQNKCETTYGTIFHTKETDEHSILTLKFPTLIPPPETKIPLPLDE